MIAYAVGEKTVCGRPMESGTKALVATPAGHSRIHTRRKRARQRIPGIRHFAQRKRRGSVAGDTQTFAALVAGNAGNTICTADKEFEVTADDANVAGARDSNCLCRRLEPFVGSNLSDHSPNYPKQMSLVHCLFPCELE